MSQGPPAVKALKMTARHYNLLDSESKKYKTGNQQVKRIRILLKGSKGQSNYSISKELRVSVKIVKTWRKRWSLAYDELLVYERGKLGEGVSERALLKKMLEVLKDRPRPGAPARITLSQKQQIVTLACRKPSEYGIPLTSWTHEMLAEVAQSEKVVESISARYVGQILKKSGVTPT